MEIVVGARRQPLKRPRQIVAEESHRPTDTRGQPFDEHCRRRRNEPPERLQRIGLLHGQMAGRAERHLPPVGPQDECRIATEEGVAPRHRMRAGAVEEDWIGPPAERLKQSERIPRTRETPGDRDRPAGAEPGFDEMARGRQQESHAWYCTAAQSPLPRALNAISDHN